MPQYRVWRADHGQTESDGELIEATDPQQAAEKWAEDDDQYSGEFDIAGKGAHATVRVRDFPGYIRTFRVHGECVPQYYSEELTEASDGPPDT